MYKKIVLAYNGSVAGQKALLDSRELAAWGQAELHLVAVMPLNLNTVVAEGIENLDQALVLQSLECEFGQGYLFSKPMRAAEVPGFMRRPNIRPGQLAHAAPAKLSTESSH